MEEFSVPTHLALIPDGNRRWAEANGVPLDQAHARTLAKALDFVSWCDELGVGIVSVWAASRHNFAKRSDGYIDSMVGKFRGFTRAAVENGRWKVRVAGDPALLPDGLFATLQADARSTAAAPGIQVNYLVGYDGLWDIVSAVRTLLAERVPSHRITGRHIEERLCTAGQPMVDLVLRTGGHIRPSSYLTWQTAEAEYYFTDLLWPDITRDALVDAFRSYTLRDRKHGA